MYLRKIQLINFKNYENQQLDCCADLNCFVGKNGSGKTNLLDAIFYLSMTKSAFNSSDNQSVRHGAGFFSIIGEVMDRSSPHRAQCKLQLQAGQKKIFSWDHQEYQKLSEHIGRVPAVLIAPNDTDLIRDSSETRRKFFDMVIGTVNRDYLLNVIRYNKYLKQRNALLKNLSKSPTWDRNLLEPYDQELIRLSQLISDVRRAFLSEFKPILERHYEHISSSKERVSIEYQTQLMDGFENVFLSAREQDILLQRTTKGIHRDDFSFEIQKHSIKKFGSQGQQKCFVISLKLAQFEAFELRLGSKPLLLLDDIFDKLDDDRILKLTELLAGNVFGQVFLTDARPERTRSILSDFERPLTVFEVVNGEIVHSA